MILHGKRTKRQQLRRNASRLNSRGRRIPRNLFPQTRGLVWVKKFGRAGERGDPGRGEGVADLGKPPTSSRVRVVRLIYIGKASLWTLASG